MNADDIYFERNGEKSLIATLGNSSGKSINISTDAGVQKLRLVSPTGTGALPLRVKLDNTVYALGSFPDGIVVSGVERSDGIPDSTVNKAYIYDITDNRMTLIATIPCCIYNAYYIKEQNVYILQGYVYDVSTWSTSREYRLYISFDGYNWKHLSYTGDLYDIVYKNGEVSVLLRSLTDSDWSTGRNFYDILLYKIKDTEIQYVKTRSGESFDYSYITCDLDGNMYFYDSSATTVAKKFILYPIDGGYKYISESDIPSISSAIKGVIYDYGSVVSILKKWMYPDREFRKVTGYGENGRERIIAESSEDKTSLSIKAANSDCVLLKSSDTYYFSDGTYISKDGYIIVSDGTVRSAGYYRPAVYKSRLDGKIRTLQKTDGLIKILNSSGEVEKSITADGYTKGVQVLVVASSGLNKYIDTSIAEGTYTIEEFASLLQNYISENSYRVLASACTISDGNFTVSMAAGQRIWICTKGESPNYAKTIRFVDDENDYSGSTVGYVSGSAYYNFYSFGTTGFANFDKFEGRNGYYDVSSYNVTITGGISFL